MLLFHKARPSHAVMFVLFTTLLASSGPVRAAMFQIEGSRTGINESNIINGFLLRSSDPNGLSHAIAGTAGDALLVEFESAARAGIAGLGSRVFGRMDYAGPSAGGTLYFNVNSSASGRYDDIVISGNPGTVTTSLNMTLEGELNAGAGVSAFDGGESSVLVDFLVNGTRIGFSKTDLNVFIDASGPPGSVFVGPGRAQIVFGGSGPSGIHSTNVSSVITSPQFTVTANTPFSLEIRLQTSARPFGFGTVIAGEASAEFLNTLTFAKSGTVFNLAGGYTANSIDAGISNNFGTVPLPGSLLLSISALAGLAGSALRQRAVRT